MIKLDLKRKLDEKTLGDVLVYLEKRPLIEVYDLFNRIVAQLAIREANGPHLSESVRPDPASAGGGNADVRNSDFSTLPAE